MAKAVIHVDDIANGFTISVSKDDHALVFPEVLITKNYKTQETTYQINTSLDNSITESDYEGILDEVREDGILAAFLQIAQLVYLQKTLQNQGKRESLINELLSL